MPPKKSIRKRSGYGEELKGRLTAAKMTQLELASAAGISRQTLGRAVTSDEISAETEQRIEDALSAKGEVRPRRPGQELTKSRVTEKEIRPPEAWVRASDLADWSSRRDAQEELPEVVRRLVHMTVDGIRRLSFRSGEGVQLGGWDGRVFAAVATTFVPEGESGWEIGTTAESRSKAQKDYETRTASPGDANPAETTFVFVTSRRWRDKDEWSAERRRDGTWKDVRVYDADDLATWLEHAPSVHLWLSGRIGTFPAGAEDLGHWWDVWSRATRPSLSANFVLAGREKEAKKIRVWRDSPTQPIAVRSESRDESVAAVAAAFSTSATEDADDAMARSIVIEHEAAWRGLVSARTPLILIPLFDAGGLVADATRRGHAVVIPLGEGDATVEGAVILPPIETQAGLAALLEAEARDEGRAPTPNEYVRAREERARDLAKLARRSMTGMRRHIGLPTLLQIPAWARPDVARAMLGPLFAGRWNDRMEGDRETLATLSGKPYERIHEDLIKYSSGTDPLFRHQATVWYLVLPEDAWSLLAKYANDDDVARFKAAAVKVLGTPDPRFDLPADQRWMAAIHGKASPRSEALYHAIATTLAILGTRAEAIASKSSVHGGTASLLYVAENVVRDVLTAANEDPRIWASLSSVLGELAEAAPDAFLDALDAGVQKSGIVVPLFVDEGDGFFSSSSHAGVLWALERLAWSPTYVGRAVRLLADLTRLDPGGKSGNRPSASLNAIFRPWMPQTLAPLAQRFRILDDLAERDDVRAWDVLLAMLPRLHAIGTYSSQPEWREWAAEERPVTNQEHYEAVTGAVSRMLSLAGANGSRWAQLLEVVQDLGPKEFDVVLCALEQLDATSCDNVARSAIWDGIRKLVANHRGYPDAKWAMPGDRIDRVDALRNRFIPADNGARYGWLFTWHPVLPTSTSVRSSDPTAHDSEVRAERMKAAQEIFAVSGLSGLVEFAAELDQPQFLGEAMASAGLSTQAEELLLVQDLAAEPRYLDALARGYAFARQSASEQWVSETITKLKSELRPSQVARLIAVLPIDRKAWDYAASLGEATERGYWSLIGFIHKDADLDFALRKLLTFDRVAVAIDLMGMYVTHVSLDAALVVDALQRMLRGEGDVQPLSSSLSYHLAELLDYLGNDASVDRSLIATFEWNFLPLFEHSREPKILHEALAEDPSLFVDLVSLVFRAEGEPKRAEEDITEAERTKARRAYDVLHSWRTVPGTRTDNSVDGEKLRDWVKNARALLANAHRTAIGDQQIGNMLSGASLDGDGTWPPASVRRVIEEIQSEHLETGISIGKFNSRGVVWRGRGGDQERALAEEYEGYAAAVADSSHRTARMLREIAAGYWRHALREDQEAALEEDLD